MFKDKQSEEYGSNLIRDAKVNRKNNRVFILQYSPERTVSKRKNEWEKVDSDQKKEVDYIIKKQALRDQAQKVSPTHGQINHRFNIDRLINLISKSKTQSKHNQSGCEKMVRALIKLNARNGTFTNMKWAIQNLKKYTMTCSSNNYELFIQSKHLNVRETPKWVESSTNKQNAHKQKTLEKIAEYSQQYLIKNESSGISIANQLSSAKWRRQYLKIAESSFNSIDKQTTPKHKRDSAGYLTTRQDLQSQSNFRIPTNDTNLAIIKSKSIDLCLSKASKKVNFKLDKYEKINQTEKVSNPLKEISKDSKTLQVIKSQQVGIQKQYKECLDKIYLANRSGIGNQKKTNSPIFSLMYALPTELDSQNINEKMNVFKPNQVSSNKNEAQIEVGRTSRAGNAKKKQQILTPSQYAQKMLFGIPQTAQQKISKQYRNFLQEKSRKRVTSLPKITFTYVSREKYNADSRMNQKNPQINQNNGPFLPKHSISKNSSREQLQSTFQSKAPNPKQRQNLLISRPNLQNERSLKNSASRQKILVMQNPIGPAKIVQNQYYGDQYQVNRQIPQSLEMKRERILTAQPGWQKEVQFVGIEQQMPGCCWQQKQVRSRSLNQRVLVRNNSQNNIVFR